MPPEILNEDVAEMAMALSIQKMGGGKNPDVLIFASVHDQEKFQKTLKGLDRKRYRLGKEFFMKSKERNLSPANIRKKYGVSGLEMVNLIMNIGHYLSVSSFLAHNQEESPIF